MKPDTEQKHTFNYRGQERVLFKRKDSPDAPWWIRLSISSGPKRKWKWKSLKTPVRKDAERAARDILNFVDTRGIDKVVQTLRGNEKNPIGPTLGKIIEAYQTAPIKALEPSRESYMYALRYLVEKVLGKDKLWTDWPLSVLDAKFVFAFKKAIHDKLLVEKANDAEREKAWRSGNSMLRQARAVFSKQARAHFRHHAGLQLPDLTGFMEEPGFAGVTKRDYEQPDDDLMAETLRQLELTRESHPDRYLACWLALGFGLRKGEIAAARTDWFTRVDGRVHVEIRAAVGRDWVERPLAKNRQVNQRVAVANGAWPHLEPFIAQRPKGAYLIGGTDTYRKGDVFRDVSDWFRSLGWRTEKTFHELRAYAGSRIIKINGLFAASQWLRHAEMTTTQNHYGRYARTMASDEPLNFSGRSPSNLSGSGCCTSPAYDECGAASQPAVELVGKSAAFSAAIAHRSSEKLVSQLPVACRTTPDHLPQCPAIEPAVESVVFPSTGDAALRAAPFAAHNRRLDPSGAALECGSEPVKTDGQFPAQAPVIGEFTNASACQ